MAPSAQTLSTSTVVESEVRKYSSAEVGKHATDEDCWVVIGRNVYDVTPFLDKHPGGADFILKYAGEQITNVMKDEAIHTHTAAAYTILRDYKVGELDSPGEQPEVDLDIDSSSANDLIGYREDMIDWNKGMVLQVHKIGKEYNKWVHSPVSRSVKMFDNPFVEFFSNTPWYAIPLIWIPVTLFCVGLSYLAFMEEKPPDHFLNKNLSVLLTVAWNFMVGVFTWTLLEYVLHRYVFHLEPNCDSAIQITIHFFFHGLHHKVPFDGGRLVFPPIVASVFAFIFWQVLSLFCEGGMRWAIFGGGICGYICYDMIHYYIHHGTPREGSYMYKLKRYHNAHHFVDHDNGFGISSKLWDIMFDTTLKIRKMT